MIDYILSHLSFLSAILNIIGWIAYIFSQIKGITKSNPVGWLMSLIIVVSSYISTSIILKDWTVGLMYAVGIIPAFIVFLLSLRNKFKPIKQEYILFIFGLFCLFLSKIEPNISLFLISLYLFGTYYIFARSLFLQKTKEYSFSWIIWSLAAICQIFAIANSVNSDILFSSIVLPCSNFFCWVTIALLSLRANKGAL